MTKRQKRQKRAFKPSKPVLISPIKPDEIYQYSDGELKTEINTEPSIGRDFGRNLTVKSLSLMMYYDATTGRWRKLGSATLGTAQIQGRFYTAEPSDLISDQFADIRISENQEIMVREGYKLEPTYYEFDLTASSPKVYAELLDYGVFDKIYVSVIDVPTQTNLNLFVDAGTNATDTSEISRILMGSSHWPRTFVLSVGYPYVELTAACIPVGDVHLHVVLTKRR